jgi:hypothetical protein
MQAGFRPSRASSFRQWQCADKRLNTTSNGVPSCDIGDGIIEQRRMTMNYKKPEVATLGKAVGMIEFNSHDKMGTATDSFSQVNPAYDLDE